MGQTFSFLPSLIPSCNLSNASAPFHSKPGQQLNWQREDLTEGSNTERGSVRMGQGWGVRICLLCRKPTLSREKVGLSTKPKRKNKKQLCAALFRGATELPGIGEGSLASLRQEAGSQETQGHCSVQQGGHRSCKELH